VESARFHNYIPNWVEAGLRGQHPRSRELAHADQHPAGSRGPVVPQDRLCEGCLLADDGFRRVTHRCSVEKYINRYAPLAMGLASICPHVVPNWQEPMSRFIGAGPAGLGCADVFGPCRRQASVFDRYPNRRSLLDFGIPSSSWKSWLMSRRREIF